MRNRGGPRPPIARARHGVGRRPRAPLAPEDRRRSHPTAPRRRHGGYRVRPGVGEPAGTRGLAGGGTLRDRTRLHSRRRVLARRVGPRAPEDRRRSHPTAPRRRWVPGAAGCPETRRRRQPRGRRHSARPDPSPLDTLRTRPSRRAVAPEDRRRSPRTAPRRPDGGPGRSQILANARAPAAMQAAAACATGPVSARDDGCSLVASGTARVTRPPPIAPDGAAPPRPRAPGAGGLVSGRRDRGR